MERRAAERRARIAYEAGRLRWGLPRALVVAPIGGAAYHVGASASEGALLTSLAVGLTAIAGWRSRVALLGAWTGALTALVPIFTPVVSSRLGHLCVGGACFSTCTLVAGVAGAISGAMLAAVVVGLRRRRAHFLLANGALITATSLVICGASGSGTVVGLIGGLLIGAALAVITSTRATATGSGPSRIP